MQDGSGAISAAATLELQNPNATTPAAAAGSITPSAATQGRRLTLRQLASAIINNPGGLIAPTGSVAMTPGPNVNVSNKDGNQTEPVIVINPTNPQQLFIASNNHKAGSMTAAYSLDGGATWTPRDIATGPAPGDEFEFGCCDPAAAYDSFGNLYFAYLNNDHNKITLLQSTDAGQTFTQIKQIAATRFDRPVLATGKINAAGGQAVWLAYADVGNGIFVTNAAVTGAGASGVGDFSTPVMVPTTENGNFADLAIGPNGQALIAWQYAHTSVAEGPSTISVAIDPDGIATAQTFGNPILVQATQVGPENTIPAQPKRKITADPHVEYALAGPNIGRAFLVYTDETLTPTGGETGNTQVVMRFADSKADGTLGPWSKAKGVYASKLNSEFFPHLAVDPKSGMVAVSWYDTRSDATSKTVEFWATVSTDGGASFATPKKVSSGVSNQALADPDANDPATDKDFGDYTGLAFYDGEFYPAWADNSTTHGKFDIFTTKVSVTKLPAPPPSPAAPAAADGGLTVAAETSGLRFTGSANLVLPITVNAGFMSLPFDANRNVTLEIPDLGDLGTVSLEQHGLDDVLAFDGMDFQQILAALRKLVLYLVDLQKDSALSTKLPLINHSAADLLKFADKMLAKVDELQANPQQSIQAVETFIRNDLGLPVTLAIDTPPAGSTLPKALKFMLDPSVSYTGDPLSLSFDIGDNALVGVGGAAVLNNLSLGADLHLDFGLTLDGSYTPFVYDSTGLELTASASATVPTLSATLGGFLGIFVKNGTMTLDEDGSGPKTTPAKFAVKLKDITDDRYALNTVGLSDAAITLDAGIDANLPLFFPTETTPLGSPSNELKVHIAHNGDFNGTFDEFAITPPDVDLDSVIANFDIRDDLSGLLDGVYTLLGFLQNAMESGVLNKRLPVVGNGMTKGADFIKDVREKIQALKSLPDRSSAVIQQKIIDVLTPILDMVDVQILHNDGDNVEYLIHLKETVALDDLDFNAGLPALGLNVEGKLDAELNFEAWLGVGVSRQGDAPKIYFDTAVRGNDANGKPLPEFTVGFDIGLEDFEAGGTLGFLDLEVTDSTAHPTKFAGGFAINVLDPSGTDNRLTVEDVNGGLSLSNTIDARLTANADVNLDAKIDFGTDEFPSLGATFALDWAFDSASTAQGDRQFGGTPRIAFNDITLQLGSFFDKFAGPVLSRAQSVLAPLQPIIDFVQMRLEPLEKISAVRHFFDRDPVGAEGHDQVTVLEVIRKLDSSPVLDFIDGIIQFNKLVGHIPQGIGSSVKLNLGHFDIGGDLRTMTNLDGAALSNVGEANVAAQLGGMLQTSAFAQDLQEGKLNGSSASGGKFELPLLQSPSKVFKLLLGQDVDLFKWDVPALDLNLEIHKTFPLLGPIGVTFGGEVGVKADIGFGYDTFGLRTFKQSHDPDDIINGFYLMDKPSGSTLDPAEISAFGKISVAAGFDAIIVSANVGGALVGTLDLNLNNPDNDPEGKVRALEFADNFAQGPLCIFDPEGALSLQLFAHASVGVWPFKKSFNYDSPLIEILSFSHECKDDPATQQDPILATDIGGGVLRLNMGPYAAERITVDTTDGDENFTVTADPNTAGNVLVSAFGFTQSFSGITSIFADAGAGNDVIAIEPTLDVTSTLIGGGESDTMTAGKGSSTMVGDNTDGTGDGADVLTGGAANDNIKGLAGNDIIIGGGGNDTMNGQDGDDSVYGEAGNDSLIGGAGNDLLVGGAGNDIAAGGEGNDLLDGQEGNDSLRGEAGDDEIIGDLGNDTASGGDGVDSIAGGEGNDSIDGGNDADLLAGSEGDDAIIGGAGNDNVIGEAGNDNLAGGDGEDILAGGDGNDSIAGDADNDAITGDAGNDTAGGGAGDDKIEGGADNDVLDGEAGADDVRGGDGDDKVSGGDDNDALRGDAGNDQMAGNAGDDVIEGGTGNDTATGDAGADVVHGQEDADVLSGADGKDSVFGDAGNDRASGGNDDDEVHGGADNDLLNGNGANDALYGDSGDDLIHGDTGNDTALGGTGRDVMFGEDGNDNLAGQDDGDIIFGDNGDATTLTSTNTGASGGGDDIIDGGAGDDTAIGGQGSDKIAGGEGNDDLIGGHNVAGGAGGAAADGADVIDGGVGADVIAGDNASITRPAGATDPRFRPLSGGGTLYNVNGTPAVGAAPLTSPSGAPSRLITLFDFAIGADDYLAGGANDDLIFGQAGNDLILGDADTSKPRGVVVSGGSVANLATDGDDYIEGNAGDDRVYGNLGQDDLIGGSSDLFGQNASADRADGADVIFGGAGIDTSRNALGDTTPDGHANDADVIAGDNATIYRPLNSAGQYLKFNYDNYGARHIIPRSIKQLDYTADSLANESATAGGGDVIHGESGDDTGLGMAGNDAIFGDAQDDDLVGGSGNDWISGGAGEDGVIGDDGMILTSRNGLSEPLAGINAPNALTNISTNGQSTGAWVYITGRLNKVASIANGLNAGGNDVIYGGIGDDFLHGGGGNDGVSGAEAQAAFFTNPTPGAITVNYDPATRKLAGYDANKPLVKINGFFLNFDAVDGGGGAKINDGKDRIFGDGGHDWLVGGTQNDRLFGGTGDDMLNADDNLDTASGANSQPDAPAFADADFAFGGTGLDVLIANTGADRLFDWKGEFNTYVVPFNPFGIPTASRLSSPDLMTFLLNLGRESGADRSLVEPNGELGLSSQGDTGGPRDPQGPNAKAKQDTSGGPEDDRNTALPL